MNLEAQIARFPRRFRERVRRCAALSDKVGQLAFTFPVLLHALATDYGPREARLAAIELVELGRPLAEIALAIGLPLCLRRIPPEACCDRFAWAGCSQDFSRSLANHLPASPPAMRIWLSAVFYAAHACDETFACWVARQQVVHEAAALDPATLLPLALLAWHSQREDAGLRRLAFTPWTPRISYKTAVLEAKHWLNRVKLVVYFTDQPISDTWLDGGSAGGFEFVPVVTADHIINERLAMKNCVDGYAEKLAFNRCRLFSVRCLGERVGLIEIVPGPHDPCVPQIAQVKGPQNCEVSSEVRRAAGSWLRRQRHRRILPQRQPCDAAAALKLQALLAPYRAAMAHRGALVGAEPLIGLSQLDDSLVRLADLCGLSGWPFARRA